MVRYYQSGITRTRTAPCSNLSTGFPTFRAQANSAPWKGGKKSRHEWEAMYTPMSANRLTSRTRQDTRSSSSPGGKGFFSLARVGRGRVNEKSCRHAIGPSTCCCTRGAGRRGSGITRGQSASTVERWKSRVTPPPPPSHAFPPPTPSSSPSLHLHLLILLLVIQLSLSRSLHLAHTPTHPPTHTNARARAHTHSLSLSLSLSLSDSAHQRDRYSRLYSISRFFVRLVSPRQFNFTQFPHIL
jgi:hypothetical protein